MAGPEDQAPPTFGIDFWAAAARRADAVDTSLARVPDDWLDEALWEMTSVPTDLVKLLGRVSGPTADDDVGPGAPREHEP